MRRNRPSRDTGPEPLVLSLAVCTAARARTASFREGIALVLEDVAAAMEWPAAHAWLPGDEPGTWSSSRLWCASDGIGLATLRRASFEEPPAAARGHLALALETGVPRWSDLSGLRGTPRHAAALDAGMVSALACPVYASDRPVALLEWYLPSARRPAPYVLQVTALLSLALTEAAERVDITC